MSKVLCVCSRMRTHVYVKFIHTLELMLRSIHLYICFSYIWIITQTLSNNNMYAKYTVLGIAFIQELSLFVE